MGGAVSRFHIHVEAAQAVGAVVAVVAPGSRRDHRPAAHLTGEAVLTGMGLIVAFFVLFPFVFPVQRIVLLKVLLGAFREAWQRSF